MNGNTKERRNKQTKINVVTISKTVTMERFHSKVRGNYRFIKLNITLSEGDTKCVCVFQINKHTEAQQLMFSHVGEREHTSWNGHFVNIGHTHWRRVLTPSGGKHDRNWSITAVSIISFYLLAPKLLSDVDRGAEGPVSVAVNTAAPPLWGKER